MPRTITETYPQYTIDGIDLTEDQCHEYDELLDDCAGNKKLCMEVWRLYHFSDGDQWLPLDAVRGLENDGDFKASVEGSDLPDLD